MELTHDARGFDQFPRKLTVALTDRCNLKCFICTREEFELDRGNRGEHMPLEQFYKLEEPMRHAEVIQLSGFGESFLYPQLDEALDFIYGINPREHLIYMISNGTLLSRHWGERLDGRLNYLAISLNAANPERYRQDMHPYLYHYTRETAPEAYRGKMFAGDSKRERECEFDRVVGRIQDFMSALGPESRRRVGLHYVVHSGNFREMGEFVRLAKAIGVGRVEFNQYMVTRPENIDYSLWFHKEVFNEELAAAKALAGELGVTALGRTFGSETPREFDRGKHCEWPTQEALVFTPGSVAPCCFAGATMMGNAFKTGFRDIWFGREYSKLREERWMDPCQTCNLFHTFDDWESHFHVKVKMSPRYDEIAGHFEAKESHRRLKVLVVGAGRDGSLSLSRLLEGLYAANGATANSLHQAESFRTYQAVGDVLRKGNRKRMIQLCRDLRHDIVAGNGFGFALPVWREVFGEELKVIHLRRDRADCIRSLRAEALANPLHWTGYLEGPEALDGSDNEAVAFAALDTIRPTAVDNGELSPAAWLNLSIEERLGWYYDASHAAIEADLSQFPQHLQLATEALDAPETIGRLMRFLDPAWNNPVAPVHVNARWPGPTQPVDTTLEGDIARSLRDLDLGQLLANPSYPVAHFLGRWVAFHKDAPSAAIEADMAQLQAELRALKGRAERGERADAVAGALADLDRVEALLQGFDWRRYARSRVYPVVFFLHRMYERESEQGHDLANLAGTFQFLDEQVESLREKSRDDEARQAVA